MAHEPIKENVEDFVGPQMDGVDTEADLNRLREELSLETSEEKREKLLLDSMQEFLHPEEAALLESLKALEINEKPDESMQEYLKIGTALLGAIYELQNDKPVSSVRELVDEFHDDESASIRNYSESLVFILKRSDMNGSDWFSEVWKDGLSESRTFALGAHAVAEEMDLKNKMDAGEPKNEKEEGILSKIKESLPGIDKKQLSMGLLAGGIGVAMIWGLSKLFKRSKDRGHEKKGLAGDLLKTGALATGFAFVAGRVLGYEGVRSYFGTGPDSWLNKGFVKALVAFSHGEFTNAFQFLSEGGPSLREQKQFKSLSEMFEVDPNRLTSISRMKFDKFMSGKKSTATNLPAQKSADKKVRDRINLYYMDKIELIPNYETLTMEQIFTIGLKQGIFRSIDTSDLPDKDADNLRDIQAEKDERLKAVLANLESPEENMDEIREANLELLSDIQSLDEHVDSYWGEFFLMLESMLGFGEARESADDKEYGDIKAAKADISSNFSELIKTDHEGFSKMATRVQDFEKFLDENPNPLEWNEDDRKAYERHKTMIVQLRMELDAAFVRANKMTTSEFEDDVNNPYDLIEDGEDVMEFTLHSLWGVTYPWRIQYDWVMNGDQLQRKAALVVGVAQAGGVAMELLGHDFTKGRISTALKVGKGFVTGPIKPIKGLYASRWYYDAFKYSPEDLVKGVLKGELSLDDLRWRSEYIEKYGKLYERAGLPGEYARARKAKLATMRKLINTDTNRLKQWKAIANGTTEFHAESSLADFLDKSDVDELIEFHKAGGLNPKIASKLKTKVGLDGKVSIQIEGDEIHLASTAEEADKILKELKDLESKGKTGKIKSRIDDLKMAPIKPYLVAMVRVLGAGFTLHFMKNLSEAEGKEEVQQVVGDGTIGLLLAMGYTTADLLGKTPKNTIGFLMMIGGGILAGYGFGGTVSSFTQHYLDKYPNRNAITDEAKSFADKASKSSLYRAIANPLIKAGTRKALETAAGKKGKEIVAKKLASIAKNRFAKALSTSVATAVKIISKKGGAKVAVALGLSALDGPALFGEAIGAAFLAWTAKDAYDLGLLFYEGYHLNKELERRLPLPVNKIQILAPAELLGLGTIDDENAEGVFLTLMQKPNAKFKVQRKGDAGWEVWETKNGEVASLEIQDFSGKRITGMTNEDVQAVVAAQYEMEKEEEKEAKKAA